MHKGTVGARRDAWRRTYNARNALTDARLNATPSPHVPAQLPARGIHRILVCRITKSLGNTLLVTPLIRELQALYPGAEIDVLTRSGVADEVFGTLFPVRSIFRVPGRALGHPLRILGNLRRVRATTYDLVIDPSPRSGTGRLWLSLARARFKLGFAGGSHAGQLTHAIAVEACSTHFGKQSVDLLRAATGRAGGTAWPPLDIGLGQAERDAGRTALALIAGDGPGGEKGVVGIFANATGHKRHSSEWWNRFLPAMEPLLAGYRIVEIVPAFGRSLLDDRYPAFYASDIRKLASVLSSLSLYVSADCGVMHLACATGTPVAGLFNVSDPANWGPYGPRDAGIDTAANSPERVAELVRACLP